MSVASNEQDRWVQSCLQGLVAPSLTVDGVPGPRTRAAVKEFQRRVAEFVPGTRLTADGVVGPATIAALEAASKTRAPGHEGQVRTMAVAADTSDAVAGEEAVTDETATSDATAADETAATDRAAVADKPAAADGTAAADATDGTAADDEPEDADDEDPQIPRTAAVASVATASAGYEERRVRVRVYGSMGKSSSLLVPVPSTSSSPRRLHRLAAQALTRLAEAVRRDVGLDLKLASAWRPHRWESRAQYEAVLIKKYGSVAAGKRWLAFDSPHETGLAIDIGVGGLKPSSATVDFQRKQPLHKWLVAHAGSFGWHPYKVEPWHWEYPLSLAAYKSGELEEDDPGPPEEILPFGFEEEEDVIEDFDLEETELAPGEVGPDAEPPAEE